jgi:hypothetical protein
MEEEMTETALTVQSPAAMIAMAVQQGTDLTQLERLLDLQIRYEANEAKKAYTQAMADFKADPPDIYKDKTNKQYNSKYSSIDALVNPTIPQLSKYGLSHRWDYPQGTDGKVSVSCILTHSMGHSETVTMTGPVDASGSKNPIQQIKSAMTYLKIATFEAVTGLVSREANLNDDGNGAGTGFITPEMVKELNDLITNTEASLEGFLKYMAVEKIEEIPLGSYGKAKAAFEAKKKAKK